MKRNTIYIAGFTLASVFIYILINRAQKKKLVDKIYALLDGTVGDTEKDRILAIVNRKKSATLADAFNPNFFIASGKYGLTKSFSTGKVAEQKAKDINQAWGIFNDDEEKIYGVLKSLISKLNVAQVSHYYNKNFKKDLYSELNYRLSDSEKKVAFAIIEQLPSI